ncbi:MAG: hypothetical protein K6E22_08570 [Treponema sp.]|nr:hypothetical protein [Treponema sp.]
MQVTVKDFSKLNVLIEFLEAELAESKEIILYCFMATDQSYWDAILKESGFTDKDSIKELKGYLGNKKYSNSEFSAFMDFVCKNPFFECFGKKEFYEIEIYTKRYVYFVNPALKRILLGKKNLLDNLIIGDLSKKYWKYEYANDTWELIKI